MKNSSKCNFIDYLRKPKLANIAMFDVIGTFGVAVLIGYLVNKKHPFKIHLWINIIVIFFLFFFSKFFTIVINYKLHCCIFVSS